MRAIVFVATLAMVSGAKYTGPTNQAGLNVIKNFEGWRPHFYLDPVGIKTIGYGHACHVSKTACTVPINGKYYPPLTKKQGNELLASDLKQRGYESCVKNAVTYSSLKANQFSALVSFVYNLGCRSLQTSTLLKKLNKGDTSGASKEFAKWVYAGKKKLEGLVRRREAERVLFCSNGGCGSNGEGGGGGSKSCIGSVTANSLIIRSKPSTSGSVVGSLKQEASVTISGRSEGTVVSGNKFWFKIPAGYISAFYVNIASSNGASWCSKK